MSDEWDAAADMRGGWCMVFHHVMRACRVGCCPWSRHRLALLLRLGRELTSSRTLLFRRRLGLKLAYACICLHMLAYATRPLYAAEHAPREARSMTQK